jgi:hypothetical protein
MHTTTSEEPVILEDISSTKQWESRVVFMACSIGMLRSVTYVVCSYILYLVLTAKSVGTELMRSPCMHSPLEVLMDSTLLEGKPLIIPEGFSNVIH